MRLKLLPDSVYPLVRFSGGVSIGKRSWERRFFPVAMRWTGYLTMHVRILIGPARLPSKA